MSLRSSLALMALMAALRPNLTEAQSLFQNTTSTSTELTTSETTETITTTTSAGGGGTPTTTTSAGGGGTITTTTSAGGDPAVELTKMLWEHESCSAYEAGHKQVSLVKITHTIPATNITVSCVGGEGTAEHNDCKGDGEDCVLPWMFDACKGIKVADEAEPTVSQTVCWAADCAAGTGGVTITGAPEQGSTWWKNKSDNAWSVCSKDRTDADYARVQVIEYHNSTCVEADDKQIVKVFSNQEGASVDVVCLVGNDNNTKKQTGCVGDGATECELTAFTLSECTFGLRAEVSGSTTVEAESTCWSTGIDGCPKRNIHGGRPKSGDKWEHTFSRSQWQNCQKENVDNFDYIVKIDRVVRISNAGCIPHADDDDDGDDDDDLPRVDSAILLSRSDADKVLKIKCTLADNETPVEADYTLKGQKAIVDLGALDIDLKSCVKLGLDVHASATDSTLKHEELVCFKDDVDDDKCTVNNTFPAVSLTRDQHLDSDTDDLDKSWDDIQGHGCNPSSGGGGTSSPPSSSVRLEAGLGLSALMMAIMMMI